MPVKSIKPKIKVEEISDEEPKKNEPGVENKSVELKEPIEVENPSETIEKSEELSDTSIPKVTSFSYLDSNKQLDNTDNEDKTKNEQLEKDSEAKETESKIEEKTPEINKNMSSEDIKEWLKDVKPDTTKDVEKSNGPNFKIIILITIILFIIGAIIGGLIYYKNSMTSRNTPNENDNKSVSLTSTPSPTPEVKVDLTKYSVSVLNGSGVTGEAKKVKDMLIEKDFSENKISVGNADSSDYESTSVSLKKDIAPVVFESIKSALEPNYNVVKSDKDLDNNSSFDLIIIVGKTK